MLRMLSLLERLITLPLKPPQDAADELLIGLADTTRRTYKKAFRSFLAWASYNQRELRTAADYDHALW